MLGGGGVYLNVGSAVLLPEVFLKAVTLARNLGHDLSDFATANLDFIQSYRPNTNVVAAPDAGRGPRLQPDRPPRAAGAVAGGDAGGGGPRSMRRREMLFLTGAAAAVAGEAVPEQRPAEEPAAPATGGRFRLEARPAPLEFDPATTAVIVVDMQNDFGAQGGMFERAGIDISMIQAAVGPTARVLAFARESGIRIVYLKMALRPDLSDLGPSGRARRASQKFGFGKAMRAPDGREGRTLIRDTWNTDVLPALKPQPPDKAIYKHRFSGFFQTELDDVLKQAGTRTLVFTGCTTSVCVESTLRDAAFRDYDCVVLADCTGEPIGHGLARSNHEASLLLIQTSFGWVSSSSEFLARVPAS